MPTTSIIIVAYNCADVIQQNIESSIKEQDTEVVLIDNASTDNTPQLAECYKDQIKLIVNPTNKGFTYACNQGIKIAQGKYILLLNPDAWLERGSLDVLVKKLENNPEIGAIAPLLMYPDGNHQNYTRTFPTVSGLWVESFVPMRWWNNFSSYRKYTCQELDFKKEQQVEQPAGAALLLRKQWLLDEQYFIYGSDVDLCKSIIDDGYQIIQTPESIVFHHQSKGGTENHALRPYLDLDNYYGMQYFFKKHKQRGRLISYRIVFGLSLFLRAVLSSIFNQKDKSTRWMKLTGFIKQKNFKDYYA